MKIKVGPAQVKISNGLVYFALYIVLILGLFACLSK